MTDPSEPNHITCPADREGRGTLDLPPSDLSLPLFQSLPHLPSIWRKFHSEVFNLVKPNQLVALERWPYYTYTAALLPAHAFFSDSQHFTLCEGCMETCLSLPNPLVHSWTIASTPGPFWFPRQPHGVELSRLIGCGQSPMAP